MELREVRDATLEVAEAMDIAQEDGDESLTLAGSFAGFLEPSRGLSPTSPVST